MMASNAPPPVVVADDEFKGSVVLITGIGRRGQTGEVVAAEFARRGATLVIVDRNDDAVKERAADLSRTGATVHPFASDLTDAVAVGSMSESVTKLAPGGVAAVVHMAGGFAETGTVADTDSSAWQKMGAINLTTAFTATRALLPLVRQARGAMLYFASASALPGATVANMAAYVAAKSGVVTLMRAVAAEEKASGVRANAIAPTSIRTTENLASMGERQYVERETVAAWVLWLCSRAAGPVNGQVVRLG